MKKFLPILIFCSALLIYMIDQDFSKFDETKANPVSMSKEKSAHYEKVLKELKVKDILGNTIEDLSSNKVVIVNFWASWCKPCIEEFPSLVSFTSKFEKKSVKVIGISTDDLEDRKDIDKAIKKNKLNFTIVHDHDSKIINSFMLSAVPTSLIYKNGKLHEISNGAKDFIAEEFLEFVNKAIE